jgi:hypothetical protein
MNADLNTILTAGRLADLPLLYSKGQSAMHATLGIVVIEQALGTKQRLVSYRNADPKSIEPQSMWVSVDELSDFEIGMAQELAHPDTHKAAMDMIPADLRDILKRDHQQRSNED